MKQGTRNQEILVNAGTTLFSHALCEKDCSGNSHQSSYLDHLEKACWSGLLAEVLPDILIKSSVGKNLFIWHIHQGSKCLQVKLSEYSGPIERILSIDPSLFVTPVLSN